jgi:hypothetical protein
MGRVDGEITSKSRNKNETCRISSADQGTKHDSDEMTSSEDSGCCKEYLMEEFNLLFLPKLTQAGIAEVNQWPKVTGFAMAHCP